MVDFRVLVKYPMDAGGGYVVCCEQQVDELSCIDEEAAKGRSDNDQNCFAACTHSLGLRLTLAGSDWGVPPAPRQAA